MKTHSLALLLSVSLAGTLPSIAAEPPTEFPRPVNPIVDYESGKVREFRVTLLDEHDRPVSGVPVELYGMRCGGRWPARDDSDSRSTSAWWTFTTDDKGSLLARFPVTDQPWDHTVPRVGRFYFVAELPDGRRAVSAPVFHAVTRETAREAKVNEWELGAERERVFTEETGNLTMRLMKGRTITGMVVTTDGTPVQGNVISADHDLHIESRTGAGGEIFTVSSTSDAQGRFKLENVYPAACSFSMDGPGYWSRTQITLESDAESSTRWVGGSCTLPELPLDTSVNMRVELAPEAPKYRYHGTVNDRDGKPLSGLFVIAGVSHHPMPETWGDSHRFEHAITDASGRWELHAEGPWVRFLDIRRTEFGDSLQGEDYESDGVGLAAPGEYNFQVKSTSVPTKAR